MLSDDVLLYIFHIYRRESKHYDDDTWPWHTLAHVCQRWRNVIFAWPHHLDLRLQCESRTAAAKALDIWPTLPISISALLNVMGSDNRDDIIDALEHHDRIAGIALSFLMRSQIERCVSWMQEPFPVLRFLSLGGDSEDVPVITDTFLGGSAPRLQNLRLLYVPFPTLAKFLLSTNDLVDLRLEDITRTGYISPDTMATCLSMLKRLRSVWIMFKSQSSFPNQTNRHPPPVIRAVLPALASFMFQGLSEYSEDLISRIDAPLIDCLSLQFFYQPTFDVPHLPQFIRCIEKFKLPIEAYVGVYSDAIDVSLSSSVGGTLRLEFKCDALVRQHSLLKQIYTQSLPLLSHAKVLHLFSNFQLNANQQDSTLWLGFLCPSYINFWERGTRLGVEVPSRTSAPSNPSFE